MDTKAHSYKKEGKLIYIKKPEVQDLEYTKNLWSDYDTMKDSGGTFEFDARKWEIFYKKMVYPTDGKNFYCLIYDYDNVPVGEASFHGFDSATKIARLNIKIEDKYRNRGYGSEACKLILEYYFYEFGGEIMIDKVISNNAKKGLERLGFEVASRNKNEITYRMSKENFTWRKNLIKRSVAVIVLNGCNLINISMPCEIFNMVNKVYGHDIFDIFIVGEGEKRIKTTSNIFIDVERSMNGDEIYDIVILPLISDINLNLDGLKTFIKEKCNNTEMIFMVENENLSLFQEEILKEIKILDTVIDNSYKYNDGIIDGGKVVVIDNMKNIIKGYLYIINKLCGKRIYDAIIEKL